MLSGAEGMTEGAGYNSQLPMGAGKSAPDREWVSFEALAMQRGAVMGEDGTISPKG